MSKKTTLTFIIIFSIVAIWVITMAVYDYNLVLHGVNPKFTISTTIYEDGGTKEYTGLFYKIISYKVSSGRKDVVVGTWLLNYEPQIEDLTSKTVQTMPDVSYNFEGTVLSTYYEDGSTYIIASSDTYGNMKIKLISSTLIYLDGKKTTKSDIVSGKKIKCKVNITNHNTNPKQSMGQIINVIK